LAGIVVAEGHGGERGGEREKSCRNWGKWLGFYADFGPNFLLAQVMKCSPIYRRRKRDILSFMIKNIGLWFG
jgi:hypothetical protein